MPEKKWVEEKVPEKKGYKPQPSGPNRKTQNMW